MGIYNPDKSNKRNFGMFTLIDFVVAISLHIPERLA